MSEKNEALKQKINFFEQNSPGFSEIQKLAGDVASQTLPVLIKGDDFLYRYWFSELICYYKKIDISSFFMLNCNSVTKQKFDNFSLKLPKDSFCFFDGIEKLSLDLQDKLLELLETGYFLNRNITVSFGAGEDLNYLSEKGVFSRSLAFRLSLVTARMQSLNENKEAAVAFARFFLEKESRVIGKNFTGFTENAIETLKNHYWKGGISEIRNAVQRGLILGKEPLVTAVDLGIRNESSEGLINDVIDSIGEDKTLKNALDSFKRVYVKKILEENGNNQTKTAKVLGLQRTYVSRLMNELGIR